MKTSVSLVLVKESTISTNNKMDSQPTPSKRRFTEISSINMNMGDVKDEENSMTLEEDVHHHDHEEKEERSDEVQESEKLPSDADVAASITINGSDAHDKMIMEEKEAYHQGHEEKEERSDDEQESKKLPADFPLRIIGSEFDKVINEGGIESTTSQTPSSPTPPSHDEVKKKSIPICLCFDVSGLLQLMYPLNSNNSKFVSVGLFKELNYHPGILFFKQGIKRFILLDEVQFHELYTLDEAIVRSINNTNTNVIARTKFQLFGGVNINVKTIFYVPHVEMKWKHGSIILSPDEWFNFMKYLPCLKEYLERFTYHKYHIIEYINNILFSGGNYVPPPIQLTEMESRRLFLEIICTKKWPIVERIH